MTKNEAKILKFATADKISYMEHPWFDGKDFHMRYNATLNGTCVSVEGDKWGFNTPAAAEAAALRVKKACMRSAVELDLVDHIVPYPTEG